MVEMACHCGQCRRTTRHHAEPETNNWTCQDCNGKNVYMFWGPSMVWPIMIIIGLIWLSHKMFPNIP